MKKTCFALFAVCMMIAASAQTDKENIETGVNKFKTGKRIEAYKILAPLTKSRYFNADAEYCMGDFYQEGIGNPNGGWALLKYDTDLGMKWYKKSASDGNADAMAEIGLMYKGSADGDKKKNEKEALKWYKKSAEKGSGLGQDFLGQAYADGKIVQQDYTEAATLFKLSAAQNCGMGILSLAQAYEEGQGVTKDLKEAARLYFSLINRPDDNNNNYTRGSAIRLLNKLMQSSVAANLLDTRDEIAAGIAYCYLDFYKEGFYLLSKNSSSAYMNDTAFNWLGFIYDGNHGVPQNWDEAFKCFKKGAALGNSISQYNLANYLAVGKATVKNDDEAFKWYLKSAQQGFAGAQKTVGQKYQEGLGVKRDEVEGVKWLRKASDQGDFVAQYLLGLAYRNGKGVEKDNKESQLWIGYSAAQGYSLADDICDKCIAKRTALAAAENNNATPVYSNNNEKVPYEKSLCNCCNGTGEKVIWSSQTYVETDKYGHTHNASNYIHVRCSCCNGSGRR